MAGSTLPHLPLPAYRWPSLSEPQMWGVEARAHLSLPCGLSRSFALATNYNNTRYIRVGVPSMWALRQEVCELGGGVRVSGEG